ncbi:MAG: hypothetical protein HY291_00735 [Planctomycetes bacterium]|nr:hypothetical protein [Planctomycetota bacterium]
MNTLAGSAPYRDVFQKGWNAPERVSNYVRRVAKGEFQEPEIRAAWIQTLGIAIGGKSGLDLLDVGTGPGIFAQIYSILGNSCTGLDF